MANITPWWQRGTIYQLYVRSFQDSNGDGVGDLQGARRRLEYLRSIGVDGIWLSPTMPSPNEDWGYDITDFFDVDPELGTLADLDALVSDARRLGIAVLLDLVPTHTSGRHPWFRDALSGKGAAHRDYFVWAPPKNDGGVPNNWDMVTGETAWTFDEASGEYYLNGFLPGQPDLNWWEPRVHQELEDIVRFWLDRGIAGFRIDVAHGLYKDAQLRDNPLTGPEDHPIVRHGRYRPVYSGNRPEVHEVYRHWRKIVAGYEPERLLLGETWLFDFDDLANYYGREAPELHMAFNFPFFFADFRPRDLAGTVEATLAALPSGAVPVWTASNHDGGRFPTRWCDGDERAVKAALVVMATLPGALVLYQGDELGMTDVQVPPGLQLDPAGKSGLERPTRDRCRTPMPWAPGPNGGFTGPEAQPWLPMGEHSVVNVESEEADPSSVLNFWRRLVALRREGVAGALGTLERVQLDDHIWAYRVGGVTTVANLSAEPARAHFAGHEVPVILSTDAERESSLVGGEIGLGPWEVLVLGT